MKIGVGGERLSVRLLAGVGRLSRLSISLWESPKHPRVRYKWPAKPESGLPLPAKFPRHILDVQCVTESRDHVSQTFHVIK